MKKISVLILLFSTAICISQNDKSELKNRIFSIQQIDSICENSFSGKIISEGRTEAEIKIEKRKKTTIIKGNGGFSYTINPLHFDQTYYNTLTQKEKNRYNFKINSRLIKGKYHSGLHFENSTGQDVTGEFYYYNDALFHVKINLKNFTKNNEISTQCFDLSILELNSSNNIENILSMNLKDWVKKESDEIIKIYNR